MANLELEIIEWVRERSRAHSFLLLGIGDDMAIIAAKSGSILVSTDQLLDGVHFDSRTHTLAQIGRKAVARGLSDCAAMAVHPVAVLVSAALPKSIDVQRAKELFEAMHAIAGEFGAAVAGGDTATWGGPLAIDITVLAEPFSGIEPVRRSGARANDLLYVTGKLGGSILDKHMTFAPRINEAHKIARRLGADLHAMIDISDGLSLDLWRICKASGIGAVLEESLLVAAASNAAVECATRDGCRSLDHVLGDGEDYELLMAVRPTADVSGLDVLPLGRVTESGLTLLRRDGRAEAIAPRGYVH